MPDAADQIPAGPLTTRLERRWLFRMTLLSFFFGLFALWGLYDATVAYPKRGRLAAEGYLLDLLRMKLDQPAWRTAEVGTSEPGAELARLSEKIESQTANDFDQARHRWLEALKYVGDLEPAQTAIAEPIAKRHELEAAAASLPPNQRAKPLSMWDIPAQWLIFASCGALAIYMLALLFTVAKRRYTWEPGALRLGLPGGHTLAPADIGEFDKRKWHKFIVLLRVRPEHRTLGGKAVKLDLYCHTNLESWVLAMEKAVNPSAPESPAPDPAAGPSRP